MPTITVSIKDLCNLIGREMASPQLAQILNMTKCSHQDSTGDEMTLEVTSDRPDLLSTEGIARELRGLLGIETGLVEFKARRSRVVLRIDRSVTDIRPYMSSAVIEDVDLSGDSVRQIMQMQEKLHASYGRNRRDVSIGVHDLDTISHDLIYAGVEPEKINFIPLDETRQMNGTEILELTPKGREYADIIKNFDRYPLLCDSTGNVLSLPPIINGIRTKVTDHTKNVLLDVTGTNKDLVDYIVTLMATTLAERGATIKTVRVITPEGEQTTPNLSPTVWKLAVDEVKEVLGIDLTTREIAAKLRRMRYGVKNEGRGILRVVAPPYRKDLLHEVDLIEDVAIACGYNNLEPVIPLTATTGKERQLTAFSRTIRDLMIGFGFQEVMTFVMTSPQILFEKTGVQAEDVVEVENPVSMEYSVLRNRLLPGILNLLSYNKHVSYPQRVFECGDVVLVDSKAATRSVNMRKLSAAICDHTISYEDIQAVLYSLLQNLGIETWSINRLEYPLFIRGRAATVAIHDSELGVLGEINPIVLERFGLENPVAALEIDLQRLMSAKQKTSENT